MKFNGKDLRSDLAEAVTEAVKIHNKQKRNTNPSHQDITEEEYLEDLMLRQLEGLKGGVTAQKEFEEKQKRDLEETRKRIGIF